MSVIDGVMKNHSVADPSEMVFQELVSKLKSSNKKSVPNQIPAPICETNKPSSRQSILTQVWCTKHRLDLKISVFCKLETIETEVG